jgi:hypothetical protein
MKKNLRRAALPESGVETCLATAGTPLDGLDCLVTSCGKA